MLRTMNIYLHVEAALPPASALLCTTTAPPVLWSDLTQLGGGGSADLYQDTVDYLHTTAFTVLVYSPPVAQKMGSSTEKKSVLLPHSTGQ